MCSEAGDGQPSPALFDKQADLAELASAVQACVRCPSMAGRTRVLGPANGTAPNRVFFVAEAPGRFGADVTGVPFSGDRAGQNFERLLAIARLERHQVFVTNAVLCNPRDDHDRNRPPRPAEVRNCSGWLRAQLEVVNPAVVVAVGQVALNALALLEPHDLSLASDVATNHPWFGRRLFPVYHPAFRAQRFRNWDQQVHDWTELGSLARTLTSI